MPNQSHGNGRNVALPDENRPTWRPQDENGQRNRRAMYDEDDDERYLRGRGGHWEDREQREWDTTRHGHHGYPGAFEDRYRERGYQPERLGRGEANFGTGGMHGSGYSQGGQSAGYQTADMMRGVGALQHRMQNEYGSQGYQGYQGGHRGKGPANYQRSDERIREMVCEALTDDDRVDATHIEVQVKNGEVTLTGSVDDRQQKRFAEDCVEQVAGIKDVQNQLRCTRTDQKKQEDRTRHRT